VQQSIKHQVRQLTHVPTILKLPKILRETLRADVNVRPIDAALEHPLETFNTVNGCAVLADVFPSQLGV
jgi:hypothetical protein